MSVFVETSQPVVARGRAAGSGLRAAAIVIALIYGVAALAMLLGGVLTPGQRLVAWPAATIIGLALGLVLAIRWRDPSPAYFEIGTVYAGIVMLYGAYPAVVAIVERFEFPSTTDGRLYGAQPFPFEVASITWWYAIYLAVFCATYFLIRPRSSERTQSLKMPGRAVILASVLLLAAVRVTERMIEWGFGMHARTYSEQYILARQLPLFWRQVSNLIDGMEITLQIILIAALFCYYRRTKWVIVLIAGSLVGFAILQRGARTEVAIVILTCMQLRDLLVRRISAKTIAVAALAGFMLYLTMGVLRLEGRAVRLPTVQELTGSYTDFEGIFANAYDLKYLQHASGAFRGHPSLLFADLAAVFPQQVLPFAKTSASQWFITTFYPQQYAEGGGLAFGIIAEAITGYGVPDLILRGIIAGLLLGLIQRRFVRGPVGVMFLTFYVWETCMSYQMCRNTTLSLLTQSLYRLVPAIVATTVLAAAFRRGQALRRRLLPL